MRKILWALLFLSTVTGCDKRETKKPDRLQQVMGLQTMSELATAEYVVTKIIKANDNKTWYKVGERKILLSCKASIVAGVDMGALSPSDIRIDGENISLTLPHAKLLYINIKPEDVRTAYQDVSLFRDKFSVKEKDMLVNQAENQIKAQVPELGVLVTAETNASIFIDGFLKNLGFKNISINFSDTKNVLQ